MDTPAARLTALPLGTRVVVRHRVPGGVTDVLGYLRSVDARECAVETRTGLRTVTLDSVVAAKSVPPPPPPRPPRAWRPATNDTPPTGVEDLGHPASDLR